MSHFKTPQGICQKISSQMANFFWGQRQDEKKIFWVSWSKLCVGKFKGGLGFRHLDYFNWNPSSTWASIFKSIYYPNSSLIHAKLGNCPSWGWRSIQFGQSLLKEGIVWRVGNGRSIDHWIDPWVPYLPNNKISTPKLASCIV
uniref:Uncharacterized protein n=1 Tax=Nelumbo nucifera TaxID=4432 RepID=A0A822YS69_NELNU|nr:TPA_asm: hypothetical protein HUJ06_006017 [Nelumbo nucifera]